MCACGVYIGTYSHTILLIRSTSTWWPADLKWILLSYSMVVLYLYGYHMVIIWMWSNWFSMFSLYSHKGFFALIIVECHSGLVLSCVQLCVLSALSGLTLNCRLVLCKVLHPDFLTLCIVHWECTQVHLTWSCFNDEGVKAADLLT